MKIAHVVTYVSRDGAFGGPIAVAVAQARELAKRGHKVDLLAGWDGIAALDVPGVSVHLFRTRNLLPGFSGLASFGLMRFMLKLSRQYDAVHIHLSRDLVTLPIALFLIRSGAHVVVQTHGMVMPDGRLRAKLADSFAVHEVLKGAKRALTLTPEESDGLSKVSSGAAKVLRVANGIQAVRCRVPLAPPNALPEILFLARLHPRKRVLAFARMALLVQSHGVRAKFVVVGPDEGDLRPLLDFVRQNDMGSYFSYEGPIGIGEAPRRLAQASVYVLPSVGEVFPMTILESLSVETPVVLTQDCGISDELSRREAAIVTDGSPTQLAKAVEAVLSSDDLEASLKRRGSLAVSEYFSISAVVDVIEGDAYPEQSR